MSLLSLLQEQVVQKKVDHQIISTHLLNLSTHCHKKLLDEVSAVDTGTGKMPMHYALELGSAEVVRTLLGYGAPANTRDHQGRLPSECLPRYRGRIEQQIFLRANQLEALFEAMYTSVRHLVQVSEIAMSVPVDGMKRAVDPVMILVGSSQQEQAAWLKEVMPKDAETASAYQVLGRGREDRADQSSLALPRRIKSVPGQVAWVDIPVQGKEKNLTEMLSVSLSKQVIRKYYKSFIGLTAICSEASLSCQSVSGLAELFERVGEFLLECPLGKVPVLLCLPHHEVVDFRALLCEKIKRLRDQYVLKDYIDQNDRAIYAVLHALFWNIHDESSLRVENILSCSQVVHRAEQLATLSLHNTNQFSEAAEPKVLELLFSQIKTALSYEKALLSDVAEFEASVLVLNGASRGLDVFEAQRHRHVSVSSVDSQVVWENLCSILDRCAEKRFRAIELVKRALRRVDAFETSLHAGMSRAWSNSLIEKKICIELLSMFHGVLEAFDDQSVKRYGFSEQALYAL